MRPPTASDYPWKLQEVSSTLSLLSVLNHLRVAVLGLLFILNGLLLGFLVLFFGLLLGVFGFLLIDLLLLLLNLLLVLLRPLLVFFLLLLVFFLLLSGRIVVVGIGIVGRRVVVRYRVIASAVRNGRRGGRCRWWGCWLCARRRCQCDAGRLQDLRNGEQRHDGRCGNNQSLRVPVCAGPHCVCG